MLTKELFCHDNVCCNEIEDFIVENKDKKNCPLCHETFYSLTWFDLATACAWIIAVKNDLMLTFGTK